MQHTLTSPSVVSPVHIIQLAGHLDASNADQRQAELIEALENHPSSAYVVDMRQVTSMDSAGLMALVAARSHAQAQGHTLAVAGVSASIKIIFELTQLDQVFDVRDDLLEGNLDQPELSANAA